MTFGAVTDNTRTAERPTPPKPWATIPPTDGSVIVLAKVHLNQSGNVDSIDQSVCKMAGAVIPAGAIGAKELMDSAVVESKLADNAVTNTKIADNAVSGSKIQGGSVDTTKLADNAVPITKLKTSLMVETDLSIDATSNAAYKLFTIPATSPRGAAVLIKAYSGNPGASFRWWEESSTDGTPPSITQMVRFFNLSNIKITIHFKVYEIIES